MAKSKRVERLTGFAQAVRWSPGDAEINQEFGVIEQGPKGKQTGRIPRSSGVAIVNPGDWIVLDNDDKVFVYTHAEFIKKYKQPE